MTIQVLMMKRDDLKMGNGGEGGCQVSSFSSQFIKYVAKLVNKSKSIRPQFLVVASILYVTFCVQIGEHVPPTSYVWDFSCSTWRDKIYFLNHLRYCLFYDAIG